MFFVLAVLFVGASGQNRGQNLLQPRFQVLTPDEIMVEVPLYENANLVTFRIGVKRKENDLEDLELGENKLKSNRIFIYDERLDLKRGDVVNYLLAFRDKGGYQALTGKYVFDGVYFKKPFGRRQRFRRHISTTTQKSEYNTDEDAEEFTPDIDSRFGGRHHPHWPHSNSPFGPPQHGPPPFGYPNFGHPPFSNNFPHGPPNSFPRGPPNFGNDCNDHRHDMCHNSEPERWEKVHDKDYHCKMCHGTHGRGNKGGEFVIPTTSTTSTTTTTEAPDIDVRFSN